MSLLDLIPAPYRLLAELSVAAAALGAMFVLGHRGGVASENVKTMAVQSAWDQQRANLSAMAATASEAARASERQATADLKENANESQRLAARDRAVLAAQDLRTASAGERLQRHADTAVAALGGGMPEGTRLARQRQATAAAIGDVLSACRSAVRQMGLDADAIVAESRRRNAECAADYSRAQALTPGK